MRTYLLKPYLRSTARTVRSRKRALHWCTLSFVPGWWGCSLHAIRERRSRKSRCGKADRSVHYEYGSSSAAPNPAAAEATSTPRRPPRQTGDAAHSVRQHVASVRFRVSGGSGPRMARPAIGWMRRSLICGCLVRGCACGVSSGARRIFLTTSRAAHGLPRCGFWLGRVVVLVLETGIVEGGVGTQGRQCSGDAEHGDWGISGRLMCMGGLGCA